MNGFLHYFLSALDPMSSLGFSRAFPKLMTSALPSWWLEVVFPTGSFLLPALVVWFAYLAKNAPAQSQAPGRTRQTEPLVSVVTAGRNESATIGQCIRGALQCGYSNLEFIFVDDNSTDHSVSVARRAALSVMGGRHDTESGCESSPRLGATARRARSISAFAWRAESSLSFTMPIQ